jgi:DNA replication ATP-dependent helicase Dna2
MAADVQVLPNLLTYQGHLRCGGDAVASATLGAPAFPGVSLTLPAWLYATLDPQRRVVFLDTAALPSPEVLAGEAVSNPGEAKLVLDVLRAATAAGVGQHALGAISPYRRQVTIIERCVAEAGLQEVECLTIDKAQGRDKECIVVSFVRSNAERRAGKLLADVRRVNVAITRARAKLVMVGDVATLRSLPLFELLIGECEKRGWVVSASVH